MTGNTFCHRCSRSLTNPASVKHGYGPVCYRRRMAGDPKTSRKEMDPCTVTDANLARKVLQAIYRLVGKLDEDHQARGKYLTGEDITTLPVESFDHDYGILFPGFGKPQWFYLHSTAYDLSIWKLRINEHNILDEMTSMGDISTDWKFIVRIGNDLEKSP